MILEILEESLVVPDHDVHFIFVEMGIQHTYYVVVLCGGFMFLHLELGTVLCKTFKSVRTVSEDMVFIFLE